MALRSVQPRTLHVTTGEGRRLRVEVAGDGRRVLLAHVGSPNAGPPYERWVADAAARELTLVTYDRPGYGESTSQPGRTVADAVADVRAIAAEVGFARCAVWGFSGGGPHALGCAALAPDLVAAVATVGSPAPFDARGLDYFAGMSDEARADTELQMSDRAEWERLGEQQRDELLALGPDEFREAWSTGASPADRAALRGDFGGWLYRASQAAVAAGVDGWIADDLAFHSPWGFDPASIAIPFKVWHSDDDAFVPFAHGRWLADAIPGAERAFGETDGHLTIVGEHIAVVHEWLAGHL
jgi:pimeloyl-ACP methyl ester carboxylesterase